MKKTIILTLILTLFALPAIGETIDLSDVSYADLIELRDNVDAELKTRPEYEEKGYSGLLIGGKNIVPRSYTLTCVGNITISIWVSESSYGCRMEPSSVIQYDNGTSVMLYVEEEAHVLIENGTVIIRPATEDWVPKSE